jgi:PAS domain S-box-containing protein
MGPRNTPLSRNAALYVWSVIAVGALVVAASAGELVQRPPGAGFLTLAAATVVASLAALRMAPVPASFSISEVFTFAAALLFGPAAATIAVLLDSLAITSRLARKNRDLTRALFNATAPALAMWVAAHALDALVDVAAVAGDPGRFLELLIPLAASASIYFILDTGFVARAVAFEHGTPFLQTWRENFLTLWLEFFGGAYGGALLVICLRRFDYEFLALALPLPVILYYALKHWLDRVSERVRHLEELNEQARALEEQRQRRKEVEVALSEREEQLKAIFDNALDAMVLVDDERRFVDANPAACELLGMSYDRLCGERLDLFLDREVKHGIRERWRELVEAGQAKGEWRLVTSENRRCLVEYSWKANVIAGRHLSIWRDVTKRRQLEDQLRQAQKMETVGRLAGGVAHDFNNLLTAIIGYTESIVTNVTGSARDDAHEVLRAAERAASLTRQLLTFSRKQVLQPTVLQINNVVAATSKMLERLLGDNIELRTVAPTDLWYARVDPGMIEHVIVNLAVNARDAMPNGGRLVIEVANANVTDKSRTDDFDVPAGQYVRLSVTDNGTGMDDVIKAHLFEPFFTTKDRGKGTGLGLATVYGIVQQSEGHIRVDSIPGVGTTFRIYLPRTQPTATEERLESDPASLARGSETILVAEDEPAVRALVRNTLERQGYRVLEARDGGEALTLAQEYAGRIDLLLTDVAMPVLDGRELANRLRNSFAGMRVIYMSGYVDDVLRPMETRSGPFFQKPFTATALAQLVREVLDGRQQVTPRYT